MKITIDELKNLDILIIGDPGVGKTTFAFNLKKDLPKHIVVSTDIYLNKYPGYRQQDLVTLLVLDVIKFKKKGYKIIIEGTLGYKLIQVLNNKLKSFINYIMILERDTNQIEEVFKARGKNYAKAEGIRAYNKRIFQEYIQDKLQYEIISNDKEVQSK